MSRSQAAVLPTPSGLAVHAEGRARILPWEVARQLMDDPQLTLVTVGLGDASPWDMERWLCALAAGDPQALALTRAPDRTALHALRRHPRPWARTIDLGVLVGDLDTACCRAGLPLPGDDALAQVAAMAALAERCQGAIAVRERLRSDHPWISDAAWLSATGQLAEAVVMQGLRRDQVQRAIHPAAMPVSQLLIDPARHRATRHDVAAAMHAILDGEVRWNERGHLALRPAGAWHHTVGGVTVALGVGGLHSTDAPGVVDGPLVDLDVASYYPSIIARDGLAPPQLPDFASRVGALMQRRLAAKRARDTVASNALKFVINSLYGQLGNARSGLCSPPDALRVVLTGQLHLLELIDAILAAGAELISANTDGIVVRGPYETAAAAWEARTGLMLERTPYRRLWRTSVNDYLAGGPDGSVVKSKGRFAGGTDANASRHAAAPIVARAATRYLVEGRSLAETVAATPDVVDFALWRRARDLLWDERPVTTSVIRWVVGRSGRPIVQTTEARTRTTVAAQAIPMPDPAACDLASIDRAWYVAEAQHLVDQVLGTRGGTRQLSLLDG